MTTRVPYEPPCMALRLFLEPPMRQINAARVVSGFLEVHQYKYSDGSWLQVTQNVITAWSPRGEKLATHYRE